jgi:hypothetical protein
MTDYNPDEDAPPSHHPRYSVATRQRVAQKHLSRERYHTMARPDSAYLCEEVTSLVPNGTMTHVVHTKKLVCQFDDTDNVWGLRVTKAVRNWLERKDEWDRRMAEPKASRQAQYDEANGEFREKFKQESLRSGWFGAKEY